MEELYPTFGDVALRNGQRSHATLQDYITILSFLGLLQVCFIVSIWRRGRHIQR
jgi:hypothetical protein